MTQYHEIKEKLKDESGDAQFTRQDVQYLFDLVSDLSPLGDLEGIEALRIYKRYLEDWIDKLVKQARAHEKRAKLLRIKCLRAERRAARYRARMCQILTK